MGEPTALLGGMEFGGTESGDVSLGDVPGFSWDDMDFKDIWIHIPSLHTDIRATSPATNPWGGIDLKDIWIHVPSPSVDIWVMSPDAWHSINLEDNHVSSPSMDIWVTSPINHASGDMHMYIIQVDNLSPPPATWDMDLEDICLDVYSADVAASGMNDLEMDLNEVSLTAHVRDYSIQIFIHEDIPLCIFQCWCWSCQVSNTDQKNEGSQMQVWESPCWCSLCSHEPPPTPTGPSNLNSPGSSNPPNSPDCHLSSQEAMLQVTW